VQAFKGIVSARLFMLLNSSQSSTWTFANMVARAAIILGTIVNQFPEKDGDAL
jgi:hypothetical protein